MEVTTLDDGTLVRRLGYQSETNSGYFVRGYHKERGEYLMMDSYFDEGFPKWFSDVRVPLVKGKGIPSALYMDLILLKKFQIQPNNLRRIRICNVHEWDSVFHLNRLSRDHSEDTDLGMLFRQTRLFRSRNNVVVQLGLKIDTLKIDVHNAVFSHPGHLVMQNNDVNENEIKQLCEEYKFDYGNDQVLWNFDVVIDVSTNY